MTRIGLVSDTHLPRFGRALPRALEAGLRAAEIDRILHLGDMTDPWPSSCSKRSRPSTRSPGTTTPSRSGSGSAGRRS
jgi:predicted phosphodiesterase